MRENKPCQGSQREGDIDFCAESNQFPAGQEKRRHMRERVCPISGQGSLSKSARERRASEIITASGADTVEYFSQVVKQSHGVTFREQAKWWINHVKERRRKPIAVSTLKTWEGCIHNWLNPNIGDFPLFEINNAVFKTVIAKMSEGGLSPKTITDNYAPILESGTPSSSTCLWSRRKSRTRHPSPPK